MQDLGVQTLAQSLKSNTSLVKLDLSSNEISSFGAVSIGQILKYTKVQHLDLKSKSLIDINSEF
jgi:Leucine-rich repeat (LRR) protein